MLPRGACREQPQGPARGLELERQPAGAGLEVDQPRGEAVVAGRAALAQRVQRHVGGLGGAGRAARTRRRASGVDLLGLPGTAGEDAGRRRPRDTPYADAGIGPATVSRCPSVGSSTGDGATRTSSPRTTELARRPRTYRAARVRVARARAAGAAVGGLAARAAAATRRQRSSAICATDDYERALHAYGRSYRDIVRAFRGRFDHPPDVVAHPRDEAEVRGGARLGAVARARP